MKQRNAGKQRPDRQATNPFTLIPTTPDVSALLNQLDRLEKAVRRLRGTVDVLSQPQSSEVIAHVGSTCRGWVPHLLKLSSSVARELVALDPDSRSS